MIFFYVVIFLFSANTMHHKYLRIFLMQLIDNKLPDIRIILFEMFDRGNGINVL